MGDRDWIFGALSYYVACEGVGLGLIVVAIMTFTISRQTPAPPKDGE